MKKILIIPIMFILIFSLVSAINLEVEKTSKNEVLVTDLGKPAIFNLKIKNLGSSDNFEFYNLLGFKMSPTETLISSDETQDIELKISPISAFDYRGFYTFNYYIRGQDDSEINEDLTFKIIDLKDAFEVGSWEIYPESNSLEIYIHNKVNFDFGDTHAKFSSMFFEFEEDFTLGPNERKNFKVQLDKEDFKKLMAGFYTLNTEVTVENKTAEIEGNIKFVEKDILVTTTKSYGLIINTEIVEKINEGNTITPSKTILKKNIISRLFTTLNPEPTEVNRKGLSIYYTWDNEIKPGESLEIKMKTNWLFPLLIIILILVIMALTKQYSKTNLVLRKRVAFVKAKGGEFALKVTIFVEAKKYIERVSLIDRLPPLVKVYEKFGSEKPLRVNEKEKKIEWGFEKLEAGEKRIITYVIYSKVGVLGKFALPRTTAIYEKEGEIHETESNKAFFIAEQRKKDLKE